MADKIDIYFMAASLELAEKGRGTTSPNPMVGALVVRDREVVGRGYHRKTGDDHAEIIALKDAGEKARGATLYVNVEPCCHHGRTPPCTDAIIESGIQRVVSAMNDDNPLVCGNGIACLDQAGIEMETGVLEDQARKLNEAYLKFIRSGLPFVTLKLASTLDGKIADIHGGSTWITGPEARQHVHMWRGMSDAVMVGVGTVLADNPRLTVRDAEGSDPLRVIVDSSLRTPVDANVLADGNVLIAATGQCNEERLALFQQKGIDVWVLDVPDNRVSLPKLLKKLGERSITSVFCEGGGTLSTALLSERLIDKIIFVIAPKIIGKGIDSVGDIGIESIDRSLVLKDVEIDRAENDVIIKGYPDYSKMRLGA